MSGSDIGQFRRFWRPPVERTASRDDSDSLAPTRCTHRRRGVVLARPARSRRRRRPRCQGRPSWPWPQPAGDPRHPHCRTAGRSRCSNIEAARPRRPARQRVVADARRDRRSAAPSRTSARCRRAPRHRHRRPGPGDLHRAPGARPAEDTGTVVTLVVTPIGNDYRGEISAPGGHPAGPARRHPAAQRPADAGLHHLVRRRARPSQR